MSAFARSVHEHVVTLARADPAVLRFSEKWLNFEGREEEGASAKSGNSNSAGAVGVMKSSSNAGREDVLSPEERESKRPRRSAVANIDFVKLNEELEKERQRKQQ